MALDQTLPRWADTGGAPVLEPASGIKDVGQASGSTLPNRFYNWLQRQTYRCLQEIRVWAGYGLMRWRETVSVESSAGAVLPEITVLVGGAYIAKLSTGYGAVGGGATQTLHLADVDTAPTALSANSWYYVYAYVFGSSIAYQISADAPSGLFKIGGDFTHMYVASFKTDQRAGVPGFAFDIGFPYPQVRTGRKVMYRLDSFYASQFRVAHVTSPAASSTTVDCSPWITPGKSGRIAVVNIAARETSGSVPVILYVNGNGGRIALWLNQGTRGSVDIEVDLDQSDHFTVDASTADVAFDVVFLGFYEAN